MIPEYPTFMNACIVDNWEEFEFSSRTERFKIYVNVDDVTNPYERLRQARGQAQRKVMGTL